MSKPEINGVELDEKSRLVLVGLQKHDGEATTSEIREVVNDEYLDSGHSTEELTRHHITYRIDEKLTDAGLVDKVGREQEVTGRNPANIYALTEDGQTFVTDHFDDLEPTQTVTDDEFSDALADVESSLEDLEAIVEAQGDELENVATEADVNHVYQKLQELGDTAKMTYEGMAENEEAIATLQDEIDVSEELDGLSPDSLAEAIAFYRKCIKALRDRNDDLEQRVEELEQELAQRPTEDEVEALIEEKTKKRKLI